VVAQRAGTPPLSPILLSGIVPPLADSYFQRLETGLALRGGLYPGDTVVLTHDEQASSAPAAQGGTGKTQLAVAYAHGLWSLRAVEVLVWVTATSRDAVVNGFAQAVAAVGAGEHDLDAEAAADRFVTWLAHTRRTWALVMDDLSDPAVVENLWPAGPAGQVVITTRLRGDELGSGVPGLRIAPISGFNRREALSYLSSRLIDHPDQRIEALDLGEDLEGLPLSLAQAAAVMKVNGLGCREYRAQLAERREHMNGVRVDGVSAAVLATWSLAAECAHGLAPAGLAWPALALAAMLDPNGIPGAALTCPAACGYITGRPSTAVGADQTMVRAAITNLARVGLVSIDPASPVRTIRMHPAVHAAVRAYLPPADMEQAMLAAADALMQTWPESGGDGQLDQALRDCASALWAAEGTAAPAWAGAGAGIGAGAGAGAGAGRVPQDPRQRPQGPLWKPEAHPLLFRRGISLQDSGLSESAIAYWQSMLATGTRLLGTGHANTVLARDRLAVAHESAGRFGDAIAVFASALADRERNQGNEHPDTIAARGQLAHAYSSAGRPAEAVALYEQVVGSASQQLGLGHPVTLAARSGLAAAYLAAGRGAEALAGYQMLMTDAERNLGTIHPTTLAARDHLAGTFLANGKADDAIKHYKRLLADTETVAGENHPDAIAARASLASSYRRAGKLKDAIPLYERALADRERLLADHERVQAEREQVYGSDHADVRKARIDLAGVYQQAGRRSDAIAQYEQALADSEQVLGPGFTETLTVRSYLAAAHFADGRLMEAVALLRRALADSERYLGPDHPLTRTVRENLDAATRT
jgi:tetratricopeptide (TPR) repeat protein